MRVVKRGEAEREYIRSIGKRFKKQRIAKGFSQKSFAEAVGMHPVTIWRFENGANANGLPLDILAKVCIVLECSADRLLGLDKVEACQMNP